MTLKPVFPTVLHREAAEIVRDYFLDLSTIDSVLIVNSCARGLAVPESDLDFAILVKRGTSKKEIEKAEADWNIYSNNHQSISNYKTLSPYAHLHLDIIDGNYIPINIENGEPMDYF